MDDQNKKLFATPSVKDTEEIAIRLPCWNKSTTCRSHCGKRRKRWFPRIFYFSNIVFKRLIFHVHEKAALCGNGLNALRKDVPTILLFGKGLTLSLTILTFNNPKKQSFESIVGKEENAGDQHFFFLLPKWFLSYPEQILPFGSPLSSVNAFNLDWSKILLFGK